MPFRESVRGGFDGDRCQKREVSPADWALLEKYQRDPSKSKLRPARPRSASRCAARLCGRPRAVYRKFGICRICFRNLASDGLIPGVRRRVGEDDTTMMTDPIADMLTRIRNATRIERPALDMPASGVKVHLAGVLKDEGFIGDFQVGKYKDGEQGASSRPRARRSAKLMRSSA